MRIRDLPQEDRGAFDELARRHGTLFNRTAWTDLFGERMRNLGLYDEGGRLVGGASIYCERRWGMNIVRRAPYTPYCGPFIDIQARHPVAVLEERRAALACLEEFLAAWNPALCMLPLDSRVTDAMPFLWRGYKVIPNYTYVLDLSLSSDNMLAGMTSERRKNLTKAAKDGLRTAPAAGMQEVRDLVLQTFGRQSKAVDRAVLDAILFRYAGPGNSYAFTTYRGDLPIAMCFVVHDGTTAYYLLGGYRAEEKHHGAGAAAMFAAIGRAKELGLRVFDFEGSVIPAIERYFRGFGGRLVPYFTVNRGWLPVEMLLKLRPRFRCRF